MVSKQTNANLDASEFRASRLEEATGWVRSLSLISRVSTATKRTLG